MDIQIAERLQKLRKEHCYSQEQLADELGVSRQAVSKWERGEASPDTDNLIALARLYNISVDDVLFEKSSTQTVAEASDETEKSEEKNEKAETRPQSVTGTVAGVTVIISCIAYFLMGALWDLWHPAWLVFFAIPVITTVSEAIIKKDPNIFCFPVVVTAVYLLLGCQWGLWHPWWVLFLTIPVYYLIIDLVKKK